MQQGMIQIISRTIDLGTPYVLSSPNISIVLPDSTQVSGVATVSPLMNISANPHTFSYIYIPTMGGQFGGFFEFLYGSQTLRQPFSFWVPWTDIYSVIRDMLGVPSLKEESIDYEFNFIYHKLKIYSNNTLPEYYLFNSDYQAIFDMGITRLIASRLMPTTPGQPPSGELILFKKGTTTAQWKSSGNPQRTQSVEDMWWDDGMEILSQLPEIGLVYASDRSGDEIMTRGPLALGNTHPLAGWCVSNRGGVIGISSLFGVTSTGDSL